VPATPTLQCPAEAARAARVEQSRVADDTTDGVDQVDGWGHFCRCAPEGAFPLSSRGGAFEDDMLSSA
jgi:hypothetical protein